MKPSEATLDNWQDSPANRWAFQHVDELMTTAVLSRGNRPVMVLTKSQTLVIPGLDEFLAQTHADGFLVLRGNQVLVERYLNGMTDSTRHLFMSVSKSLCSAVFGQHVASGLIDTQALVSHYLPELAKSAFGEATVQQVLDMSVSVQFSEAYDDPSSEVQTQDRVAGWRSPQVGDPANSYEFLATLRRVGAHGTSFSYCSANTDVLAWILERVTGVRYGELLATNLWSQIGAENDAYVTVDKAGFPMANAGVCGTLRDLARFGRVILDGGVGPLGDTVIPADWILDTRRGGDQAAAAEAMGDVHPRGSYRNQFWISGDEDGSFYGVGIHGQYVWMNPAADVVVVKLSSLPEADSPQEWAQHVAFFGSLVNRLAA